MKITTNQKTTRAKRHTPPKQSGPERSREELVSELERRELQAYLAGDFDAAEEISREQESLKQLCGATLGEMFQDGSDRLYAQQKKDGWLTAGFATGVLSGIAGGVATHQWVQSEFQLLAGFGSAMPPLLTLGLAADHTQERDTLTPALDVLDKHQIPKIVELEAPPSREELLSTIAELESITEPMSGLTTSKRLIESTEGSDLFEIYKEAKSKRHHERALKTLRNVTQHGWFKDTAAGTKLRPREDAWKAAKPRRVERPQSPARKTAPGISSTLGRTATKLGAGALFGTAFAPIGAVGGGAFGGAAGTALGLGFYLIGGTLYALPALLGAPELPYGRIFKGAAVGGAALGATLGAGAGATVGVMVGLGSVPEHRRLADEPTSSPE